MDKALIIRPVARLLTGLFCRWGAPKVVGPATAAPKLSLTPMNKSCGEDDGCENSDLHFVSARLKNKSKMKT